MSAMVDLLEDEDGAPLPEAVQGAHRTAVRQAAADERARIVWWLRAGVSGPAAVYTKPDYLAAAAELADAIEHHPERFADAPTGASVHSVNKTGATK